MIGGSIINNIIYYIKSALIDTKMVSVSWAMDLCCISFSNNQKDYRLHIQCLLRAKQNGKIIFSSGNVGYSHDECEYDAFVSIINKQVFVKDSHVCSVNVSDIGDMHILFDNNVVIELIIDSSREKDEQWRFFEKESLNNHIVCYPNIICEE